MFISVDVHVHGGVCSCSRAKHTQLHTDRVHVNMSSINMYVGRERSSGLIKMTCYVTFL